MIDEFFDIVEWRYEPDHAAIYFTFNSAKFGPFVEEIQFPAEFAPSLSKLVDAGSSLVDFLHVVLGVSYFKSFPVRNIRVAHTLGTSTQLNALKELYSKGLGEFYARNNLEYPPDISWEVQGFVQPTPLETGDAGSALLAFGGGKDTFVARTLLRRSSRSIKLASVTTSERNVQLMSRHRTRTSMLCETPN